MGRSVRLLMMSIRLIAGLLVLLSVAAGCTANKPGPRTREEFVDAYATAYNAGDRSAVLALVKWDGVPRKLREELERSLTEAMETHAITGFSVAVCDDRQEQRTGPVMIGERKLVLNLPPEYWLTTKSVSREPSDEPGSTRYVSWVVGIEDGRHWFCAPRQFD